MRLWGCLIIAFAALIVAALWWDSGHRSAPAPAVHFAPPPPLGSASFADGSRIDLLQLAENTISQGIVTAGPVMKLSGTTSAYGIMSNPRITVTNQGAGTPMEGIKFETAFPVPLVIEFRWLDAANRPKRAKSLYDSGFVEVPGNGAMEHFKGAATFIAGTSDPKESPDLLIQVADGKGGWITADGPVSSDGDPNAISFATLRAWPRNLPDLQVRFATRGNPEVVFTVPNPTTIAPSGPWKTVPLPASFSCPEGTVTLDAVDHQPEVDTFPVIKPLSRFVPAAGGGWHYTWKFVTALDEQGNVSPFSIHAATGGDIVDGFQLPDERKPMRLRGRIEATDALPRTRAETVVIASGSVAVDGSLKLALTPDARLLGIDDATGTLLPATEGATIALMCDGDHPKTPDALPGNPAVKPEALSLSIQGNVPEPGPSSSALRLRLGTYKGWGLVIFTDGQAESSGISSFGGNSYSSDSGILGSKAELKLRTRWLGRLSPGQTVEVAIANPRLPVKVEFVVDRP